MIITYSDENLNYNVYYSFSYKVPSPPSKTICHCCKSLLTNVTLNY